MMLGPEVAAALPEMQRQAESLMVDVVEIRHPGGVQGPFDPDLGYAPLVPHEPYYTGKARIKPRPVQSGEQESAGQIVTSVGYVVSVPLSVTEAQPEDLVTCTASNDPMNVGRVLQVAAAESGTFITARRLSCTSYQEGP